MGKKVRSNCFIHFKRFLLISSLILVTMGRAQAVELTKETISDFQTLYPGVYTEKEKTLVKKFIAENKAIENRGAIDVKAIINGTLPKDTPGFIRTLKVTEAMVRYFNEMRDPQNQILNNAEYAKKLGYKDIIAYFSFAAHDDSFMAPYPTQARDTLLVADLLHSVTNYKPIYPGDTLYYIINSRTFKDLTPETGSIYRSNVIVNNGSIYNQSGEKVLDVKYTVMENIKIYKEGKAPVNPGFNDTWEERGRGGAPGQGGSDGPEGGQGGGPGGGSPGRASYKFTDDDFKKAKEVWVNEKHQGSTPLYWEDVKIGDQPTPTLEGPIDDTPTVAVPWGMGLGGNRTLKNDYLDPNIFKTLVRSEMDGIYRPAKKTDYILPIPKDAETGESFGGVGAMDAQLSGTSGDSGSKTDGVADSKTDKTADTAGGDMQSGAMMNFTRRDYAIRHFSDWMGDKGWLYSMSWGGLYASDMQRSGEPAPAINPETKKFADFLPENMKKSSSGDSAGPGGGGGSKFMVIKSYVYNKYVKDGEFFVDLVWWIESLNGGGGNNADGTAIVKLPSKNAK